MIKMQTITDTQFAQLLEKEKQNGDELHIKAVEILMKKNLKIATAESCTGGLLSKKITEVPGASQIFDCGVCTYSNAVKHTLLHVQEHTLQTQGAVSGQTAQEMAEGVKRLSGADIGVSVTGIAGPGGGSPEKPVGLVYMGFSFPEKHFVIEAFLNTNGTNGRETVRNFSSQIVFYTILKETANLL